MAGARVCPGMRQGLAQTKVLGHEGPVFLQPLETSDEISKHFAIGIDEPVELVSMRGRMNAGAATVLNPVRKLIERHLRPQLQRFAPFIERDHPVPRIADESKLEIALE